MAIGVCELCGKPFNSVGGKLCPACTRSVDESYIKVRKYIYQNPKHCDYISVLEATEVPEKELNYLIKKGRVEVAGREGNGARCRACGKETSGGSVCEKCMAKIIAEKMSSKEETGHKEAPQGPKSTVIPMSYLDKRQ